MYYTIGGQLYHSATSAGRRAFKYIDKVRTKSGKWRYIYPNKNGRREYRISQLTRGRGGADDLKKRMRAAAVKNNGRGYLTSKEEQSINRFGNKMERISYIQMISKRRSDDELEKSLDDSKNYLDSLRKNKSKDPYTKEITRKEIDRVEKEIYEIEKEKQRRKGNIKLGRSR